MRYLYMVLVSTIDSGTIEKKYLYEETNLKRVHGMIKKDLEEKGETIASEQIKERGIMIKLKSGIDWVMVRVDRK